MADASYIQSSFLGGLFSKAMQGRIDRPDYKTALVECLNGMPNDSGSWQRRSGTQHRLPTRGGVAGRVISFDFRETAPYDIEFTDGFMRFFDGPDVVTTNDDATILAISAANPAVVQLSAAVTWITGNQAILKNLGINVPLLQRRVVSLTKIDTTHFSLADGLTGATIDGSTLGAVGAGATIARILEIATPYVGGTWADIRVINTDVPTAQGTTPGGVILHPQFRPYVLQVVSLPTATSFATFTFAPANLQDGPYLDPVSGGTLATPGSLTGNITITLSFNAYDATRSYSLGDYATSASINYKSLADANFNNTPAISPSFWAPVSAADAIGPNGFTGSDIGRHVRLFNEPPLWTNGTTYGQGDVVSWPQQGQVVNSYWTSLIAGNLTNEPGIDPSKWAINPTAAFWTWGKITGLSNIINRALAGSVALGDMTSGGGLAAAFDGVQSQSAAASSEGVTTGIINPTDTINFNSFVGKNYTASPAQQISQAIVYPSSDNGFAYGFVTDRDRGPIPFNVQIVLNLRAKASAPANSADGTLLGSTGVISNTTSLVLIPSNDQVTAWNYVWVEVHVAATESIPTPDPSSYQLNTAVAELSLFNPPGTGVSQGFTIQLVANNLHWTAPIKTWRIGEYSDTSGWPACGTYHEGRVWLSGVIDNRIDGSRSNNIFNFAPTEPQGQVTDSNAIAYRFNAPDVNPIFWMTPEDQGIVCGTQAGEWLVRATTLSAPLTPTSIQAHRNTKNGCANIEPKRSDHTLLVVQKFRRKVLEYFADVFSGKYSAQNTYAKGEIVTKPFVAEIAYQQELVPLAWSRMDDGSFAACTYSRTSLVSSQEATAAVHRHTLGSGRKVESITMGATADGNLDSLALVTNDPATGVRHVETMTRMWEENDPLAFAWFLDNAVRPTSTVASDTPAAGAPYGGMTLNGLWPHNGKTVQVFGGGVDCGDPGEGHPIVDFTVTNGSTFVPFGDGISAGSGAGQFTQAFATAAAAAGSILVGFTYTSDAQVVPPVAREDTGARSGPGAFKTIRSAWYGVKVFDTAGLSIGTDFAHLFPVLFKDAQDRAMPAGQLYTGEYRDSLDDDYSFSSKLCWRITRPWPANITMVGAFPHTQDL